MPPAEVGVGKIGTGEGVGSIVTIVVLVVGEAGTDVGVGDGSGSSVAVGSGVDVASATVSGERDTMVGVDDVVVSPPKAVPQPLDMIKKADKVMVAKIVFIHMMCLI